MANAKLTQRQFSGEMCFAGYIVKSKETNI